METGKIINCISNRLRNRSQAVHMELGIGSAQGKVLNYILVESTIHPVYQKDLEREFGLAAIYDNGNVKCAGTESVDFAGIR